MMDKYIAFRNWIRTFLTEEEFGKFILGQGQNCATINFNLETRNCTEKESALYAIKYYPTKHVLVAWNLRLRRELYGTLNLQIGTTWDRIDTDRWTFNAFYPYFWNRNEKKYYYNKVLIVGEWFFTDFFRNYEMWFKFNEDDPECPQLRDCDRTHWTSDRERKRYSVLQKERDVKFPKGVLESYGYRCAVCRTEVQQVLQAAHLHGFEVADTDLGADTVEHGICLCANHHLMYDRGVIDFDMTAKKVNILDQSLTNTDDYRIIKKFDFTLADRNGECIYVQICN